MKKIKPSTILLIVIILLIAGGGAWIFNQSRKKTNLIKNPTQEEKQDIINYLDIKNKDQETSGKVIFTTFTEEAKEIFESNLNEGKNLIFTDTDEDGKIKQFGGLANLSKEILVYTGGDPIGKLEVIKLNDNNKKETIIESFGRPSALAISADGAKVAAVYFSNVEEDYGYSIYQMARDGENKRKLMTVSEEIRALAWSNNSAEIYFIKIKSDGQSEIGAVDTGSGSVRSIYSSDKQILSLSCSENNKIIFSIANDDKFSSGQILIVDPTGGAAKKILETDKNVPLYPYISPDNLAITYLIVEIKEAFTLDLSGEIYLTKIIEGNQQKIANANIILGWLN